MLVKHYLTIYLLGFALHCVMLSASVMGNASTNTESWIVLAHGQFVVLVVVGVYLFIKNIIRGIKIIISLEVIKKRLSLIG